MKINIFFIHEIPFVHELMDMVDLTDRGSKVFARAQTVHIETTNESEENFKNIIESVCFGNQEKTGKPVFIYAKSDKKHRFVYFREGVNQISDGEHVFMFAELISGLVSVKTDNMRKVVEVGEEVDGKFCPIKCFEPTIKI